MVAAGKHRSPRARLRLANSPRASAPSLRGVHWASGVRMRAQRSRGDCVSPRNPPGPLLAAWECHAWPQAQSCLRDSASCTPTGWLHWVSVSSHAIGISIPSFKGCWVQSQGERVLPLLLDGGRPPLPQSHSGRSGWPEDGERVGGAALLVPECWGTELFPFS